MAESGGVRAWKFFKRNPELHEAWEACAQERRVFEDAPFPIRRQTDAERGVGRFGLFAVEDPFVDDGPLTGSDPEVSTMTAIASMPSERIEGK